MRITSIATVILMISSCTSVPIPKTIPIEVQIPVPVTCQAAIPKEPTYIFPTVKKTDDIFVKSKALLADRELDKGYNGELLAALKSCK